MWQKKQRKQARRIVTPEILTEKDNFDIEMENMVKTDKWYAWKFDMLTKQNSQTGTEWLADS